MSMTKLETDTVNRSFQAANKLLAELKPVLDGLTEVYDSAGGLKTTITQEDLDSVPSFSGLTKQELDDGMYALTATVKTAVASSYSTLAKLAARA